MPFRYEFKLNRTKISGGEIGFSTSRKWEEALDEAKLSLPFLTSSTPYPMYGLLQIEITEVDTDEIVVDTESYDMLIMSDRVAPSTRYGYYRHDINAIEYTAKLDAYIMNSLAKSRSIINQTPAPFDVIEQLNNPFGDNQFTTLVNVEPIDVKTTYYANTEIVFEQVRQAFQGHDSFSPGFSPYYERDVYLTTNATLLSGSSANPFKLNGGNCTWKFPIGKWYIDYQVDLLDADGLTDGLHTLYRFYINVVDQYELSVYDVINTIRNSVSIFGGVESERYFNITRLFKIDANVEPYLKSIQAPQMYLANATARQMLMFALSYVNALPRLLYGRDIDKLTIEKYNEQRGAFTPNDLSDYSGSQNTNQIGAKSYSALQQVLPDDLNEANIFSPSQSGYQNVRSSMIQITANNFKIKLPRPIYQPIGLYVLIPEVKISSLFISPVQETTYTNLEIPLTSRWINIEEWNLKEITDNFPTITAINMWEREVALRKNKVSNLYWQQGDTEINLSDVFGTIFQSNLVINVVREAIYEYFMRNMPEPKFHDTEYLVDQYGITIDIPVNLEYLDWRFRVEYISDESLVVKHDKEDLSQINFYSELKHNQDESIINVVRASRKIYGDLQRTGNQSFSFSKYHKSLVGMYQVGQKDSNGFTITTIQKEFHNEYILATYFVTRYHNRVQQATFVDQTYRWRDNYAKTVLDRHENYGDYLIFMPPNDQVVSNQIYTKISNFNKAIQMLLSMVLNIAPPSLKTRTTVAIVRTDGMYEVLQESENYRYAISTPVSSYGLKGSLAFTFGFSGNQVAGDALTIRTGNIYNKAVRYTNEQGRFGKIGFWLLRDLTYAFPNQYPIVENEMTEALPNGLYNALDEYFGCGNLAVGGANTLGDDPLIIEKDQLTNFALTYQLHVLSYYVGLYVIGINFYTKNYLVNNPDGTEKSYMFIYTNGTRYELFEDINIKSGYASKIEITTLNSNYDVGNSVVRFFDSISFVGATSWAIGNEKDELLIACNEPLNGFDIKKRHFRPNIIEIGAKATEVDLSENLSLTDEIELSQFVFPIIQLTDFFPISSTTSIIKSTDYVLNLSTDDLGLNSNVSSFRSTDWIGQVEETFAMNDVITVSQFIFPITSFSDVIEPLSTVNSYKSTNFEIDMTSEFEMTDDIVLQTSTNISLQFSDTITVSTTTTAIQSTNYSLTLNDTITVSSTINSIGFVNINTSVENEAFTMNDIITLVQSTNFVISSLTDTMTLSSSITSEQSTNFVITLSDGMTLSSTVTVLLPKVWTYTGTTGTYDLALSNVASADTCNTQSAILAWLNTNYPPENYSVGYRVRVLRTNEDGALCSPVYYYYQITQ